MRAAQALCDIFAWPFQWYWDWVIKPRRRWERKQRETAARLKKDCRIVGGVLTITFLDCRNRPAVAMPFLMPQTPAAAKVGSNEAEPHLGQPGWIVALSYS
jgi:hypothetical protein